jgi:AcrR family transcriptional regulator
MPRASRASNPVLSPRKKPRQVRSTQLVDDILEAALRVLLRDGGARFTTVTVAREAGVSVGSLYQYFPNKAALLFRLQADEWLETWSGIEAILDDETRTPRERLARAVFAFFRSERQEAALRAALDAVGATFRDAPEAHALGEKVTRKIRAFVDGVVPRVPRESRTAAADVIRTSMAAVAEMITTRGRSLADVDACARASADMYSSYLEALAARTASRRT